MSRAPPRAKKPEKARSGWLSSVQSAANGQAWMKQHGAEDRGTAPIGTAARMATRSPPHYGRKAPPPRRPRHGRWTAGRSGQSRISLSTLTQMEDKYGSQPVGMSSGIYNCPDAASGRLRDYAPGGACPSSTFKAGTASSRSRRGILAVPGRNEQLVAFDTQAGVQEQNKSVLGVVAQEASKRWSLSRW